MKLPRLLPLGALLAALVLGSSAGQASDTRAPASFFVGQVPGDATAAGIVIATDAAMYSPGDTIIITLTNTGLAPVSPQGGLVCADSTWPLAVQWFDGASWQALPPSRTPPCVGIAAALFLPGASQTRQLSATFDLGTYRVVYDFHAVTDSQPFTAMSDSFDIQPSS